MMSKLKRIEKYIENKLKHFLYFYVFQSVTYY